MLVSVSSLATKQFDLELFGMKLQRGSDAIMGLRLGLDLQGGVHLVYQARGSKEITLRFQDPTSTEKITVSVYNRFVQK